MKKIGLKAVVLGAGVLAMSASMAHPGSSTFRSGSPNAGWSELASPWADECPGHPSDIGLACPISFGGKAMESVPAKATFGRRSNYAVGGF